MASRELLRVWNQKAFPVVLRKESGKLLIRLPYEKDNRFWLRDDHRNEPEWSSVLKCWQVPRTWLDDVVNRMLRRYSGLYVIQPYRERQKCAPACWDAIGVECECSCMGENHGSGNPSGRWYVISEALAVSYGDRSYSYKFLRLP